MSALCPHAISRSFGSALSAGRPFVTRASLVRRKTSASTCAAKSARGFCGLETSVGVEVAGEGIGADVDRDAEAAAAAAVATTVFLTGAFCAGVSAIFFWTVLVLVCEDSSMSFFAISCKESDDWVEREAYSK